MASNMEAFKDQILSRLREVENRLGLIPVRFGASRTPEFNLEVGKTNAILNPNGHITASVWKPRTDGLGGLDYDTDQDVNIIDIGGVTDPVPADSIAFWAKVSGVRVFLGFLPKEAKIECGKTVVTFFPGDVCTCAVWVPSETGGLDHVKTEGVGEEEEEVHVDVVDIGLLTYELPEDTVVCWASIDGVRVLIAPTSMDAMAWGCVYGINATGSTIPAWTAVSIPDLVDPIDSGDAEEMALFRTGRRPWDVIPYSEEEQNRHGVTQQSLAPGEKGLIRIRGFSVCQITSSGPSDRRFAMPSGSAPGTFDLKYIGPHLVRHMAGTGDGTHWAVIDVHSERTAKFVGLLTSDLPRGGSAVATYYSDGATATSETFDVKDQWSLVPASGIAAGGLVIGTYDFDLRKVIVEYFSALKIYTGRTDGEFSPLGTCVCSAWTVDPTGGLDSDTGLNFSVVDIGLIDEELDEESTVYWAELDGKFVLLGYKPKGGNGIPWGCLIGKNTSASTIDKFCVVAIPELFAPISGFDFTGLKDGSRQWTIQGYSSEHENLFGITQESILPNETGLVKIRGRSAIKLRTSDSEDNRYAMPPVAGGFIMDEKYIGPCRVVYKDTIAGGDGTKWAIVDVHSERSAGIMCALGGGYLTPGGGVQVANIYKSTTEPAGQQINVHDPRNVLNVPYPGIALFRATYDFDTQKATWQHDGREPLPWGCVYIKNTSGQTLKEGWPCSILQPQGGLFNPINGGQDAGHWRGKFVADAGPYVKEQENTFGVVIFDIAPGKVGVARIRGRIQVTAYLRNANHRFIWPLEDGAIHSGFETSDIGPCAIEWKSGPNENGVCGGYADIHNREVSLCGGRLKAAWHDGDNEVELWSACNVMSNRNAMFIDKWCQVPAGGLPLNTKIFGEYDYAIQKAIVLGYAC